MDIDSINQIILFLLKLFLMPMPVIIGLAYLIRAIQL